MAFSKEMKDYQFKLVDEYGEILWLALIDNQLEVNLGTVGTLPEVFEYLKKNAPVGSDSYIYKLAYVGKGWMGVDENVS